MTPEVQTVWTPALAAQQSRDETQDRRLSRLEDDVHALRDSVSAITAELVWIRRLLVAMVALVAGSGTITATQALTDEPAKNIILRDRDRDPGGEASAPSAPSTPPPPPPNPRSP